MVLREIRFRGKRVDNGEWCFGSYVKVSEKHGYIIGYFGKPEYLEKEDIYNVQCVCHKVKNETVVQCTDLFDKNGKYIYDGDLLRYPAIDEWEKINYVAFEVFYHNNDRAQNHVGFQMNRLHFHGSICGYGIGESFLPKYTAKLEIIGNIYDNPELLGGN